MSVVALTGTLRSGKSLEGVKLTVDNLARGRHVYTNIEGLDDETCLKGLCALVMEKCDDDEFTIRKRLHFLNEVQAKRFWDHVAHNSSVCVIDEAHKWFDAREWNDLDRKDANTWISMSGHDGHDLVFLTQSVEELDKRIKDRIEWTFFMSKIDYMGNMVKLKYQVIQYKYADIKKSPFSSFYRSYDKRIFSCYKSYSQPGIIEIGAVKRPNIFRHPIFIIIPLVLGLFVYMFFFKSSFVHGDLFNAKKITAKGMAMARKSAQQKPGIVAGVKGLPGVPPVGSPVVKMGPVGSLAEHHVPSAVVPGFIAATSRSGMAGLPANAQFVSGMAGLPPNAQLVKGPVSRGCDTKVTFYDANGGVKEISQCGDERVVKINGLEVSRELHHWGGLADKGKPAGGDVDKGAAAPHAVAVTVIGDAE
jgi:zona occludens toxin (predicted ATPase)